MCALCGVFGVEHHWSATRADGQSVDVPRRRLERRHRIALLNAMLAPTRLTVSEWQGSAYVVSTPTGRSDIADNLAEIWATVQSVRGRPFDPLEGLDEGAEAGGETAR